MYFLLFFNNIFEFYLGLSPGVGTFLYLNKCLDPLVRVIITNFCVLIFAI